MLSRDEWLDLARKLDWNYSYVSEEELFPAVISGSPWLPQNEWCQWDEPYRTTYCEYVINQHAKDAAISAVREAVGRLRDFQALSTPWLSALKLHAAALPLAEFAAVIGNLRSGRFGRDSAWRTMSTLGALDEFRHTQIPLITMHDLVQWDPQFDWTHRFYHSNNWVAIAARHLFDELLVASNPLEFAVATNFVFETGFTNLQFVALSALADDLGDRMFQRMVSSIQTDEARHAQIGRAVMDILIKHDRDYAQSLVDKWFWRSWLLFAIVTGFSMDYFTPLEKRSCSFKEFMEEWIVDQFSQALSEYGLEKPWYWEIFLDNLDAYHHMVYASAYTYRSTCWFNFVVPSPAEREWLSRKYPKYWPQLDLVWQRISEQWKDPLPQVELTAHGTDMIGFCDLCQLVLSNGTPSSNSASTLEYGQQRYIFCSEPCRWIFQQEPQRYAGHRNLVRRILEGDAPAAFPDLLQDYFGLNPGTWGKDAFGGKYSWLNEINRSAK